MYKSTIRQMKNGSPQQVIAHGNRQRQRGREPALPFRGITNPRRALACASRIVDGHRQLSRLYEYEKFMSDLPFREDFDTEVDSGRVVLAATRGDRMVQAPDLDSWLDHLTREQGITPPKKYDGVMRLGSFWWAFWGCEDYMTNPDRRLPALVIASGKLRGDGGNGGATFEVWERIKYICEANGVPLARLDSLRRDS